MLSWLAHNPRGPEAAQTMYCCLSFLCNSKLASQSCLLYSVLASTKTVSFYLHPLTNYWVENKYGCKFPRPKERWEDEVYSNCSISKF